MIFTTYWFLAFATATILLFWLLRPAAIRPWFLGAACLLFHAHFAGPAGMAPILVLMVLTYGAARTRHRGLCLGAIVLCVLTLGFYKYSLFLIGAAVHPLSPALADSFTSATKSVMSGMPPLGISFFVFEFVHYLVEVRRGGEPIQHPRDFLLFSLFFPALVAGPIKRYTQFLPSLRDGAGHWSPVDAAEGLRRIALGYAKKLLVADNLSFYIDQQHPHLASLGLTDRWLFLGALAVRILMDFSGYSDIAIGFARMFGVRLPENFNWPYAARSIQDFWQRWHISLSSWIRDYVYIPLGGNRLGPIRRLGNGLAAFALCGLWHGPAWHFVLWGLYHGLGLAVCATYEKVPRFGPAIASIMRREPAAGWVLTQAFVWIGWLLFFYPANEARQILGLLFAI